MQRLLTLTLLMTFLCAGASIAQLAMNSGSSVGSTGGGIVFPTDVPPSVVSLAPIRVLQVYPPDHDASIPGKLIRSLGILSESGARIELELITIDAFNRLTRLTDPLRPEDSDGGILSERTLLDYSVILFGLGDFFGQRDLSINARDLVVDYAKTGRGLILTHDTMLLGAQEVHPNFNSLTEITGIETHRECGGEFRRAKSEGTQSLGVLGTTPFALPASFQVQVSHANGQVAIHGNTLITGTDRAESADRGIYLHTYRHPVYGGLCAFIALGHTDATPEPEEVRLLVNLLVAAAGTGK